MKKLITLMLAVCMAVLIPACGKEQQETRPETQAETTSAPEESTAAKIDPKQAWMGRWDATDTDEYFEVYEVTDTGLSVRYNHFTEGSIELFDYDMEFDNEEHTVCSEIGDADDNGGWEYTFILGDGSITVRSQFPDQIFKKTT